MNTRELDHVPILAALRQSIKHLRKLCCQLGVVFEYEGIGLIGFQEPAHRPYMGKVASQFAMHWNLAVPTTKLFPIHQGRVLQFKKLALCSR